MSVPNNPPHPLYPERETATITIRGVAMPGWFTGPAAIWTAGSSPRIIGPFKSVQDAMKYQADHAPGSTIFPFEEPRVVYGQQGGVN